ncbi:MAG: hypothetical protein V4618_18950 [Pseudomonadota bacterium]
MFVSTVLWIWAICLILLGLVFVTASIIGRRIGDVRRRTDADVAAVRTGILIAGLADATKLPPRPAQKERSGWIVAAHDLRDVIDGPDRYRLEQIFTRWMGDAQRNARARDGAPS